MLTAIKEAARRINLPCSAVATTEEANSSYRTGRHYLILLETRPSHDYDPASVTKAIRQSTGGEYAVIVGIVRRHLLDKEELLVVPHLNIGMDRIVCESVSRVGWTNELLQLVRGPVTSAFRLRHTQSLFTALDNVRDIVQITDSDHKVTWVNQTAEKVLGYSRTELVGRDIRELHSSGTSTNEQTDNHPAERTSDPWFLSKLSEGKMWEGTLSCLRKTEDRVPLLSRVAPVSFSKNHTTNQIIYVKDPPPLLSRLDSNAMESLKNYSLGNRKLSIDVTSLISEAANTQGWQPRRASSHKGYSIDAPISKVISLIVAAQENQPSYIIQALDKVVDILKTSGSPDLFSPELDAERKRHRDPVTTDLLGALLADPGGRGVAPRRPSVEKVQGLTSSNPRSSLTTIEQAPLQIRTLLADSTTWKFDIIALERLTEHRPLVWLGMTVLTRFEVPRTLGIEESVLQNWLTLIEANYRSGNTYHNSSHAADVMQATAYFLERENVRSLLDPVDEAICLIGAIIHDVDHPGRNSAFLCNSRSELAILYNDTTVLENHHSALGFKLTHSDDRVNIFQKLDPETYKVFRQGLIDVVLATDMSKHFVHVNKFCTTFRGVDHTEAALNERADLTPEGPEVQTILRRMLIKCADVSNPSRPLEHCRVWAERIAEEYFAQTDDEKAQGLPVVMPQFDRSTCSIPKSQIGFYDFFIHDMFEAWNEYANCPELIENIGENYQFWKRQLAEEERSEADTDPVNEEVLDPGPENSPIAQESEETT
jgi:high affinity cAMP-specific and IBMX-insensitive 3',5'-cyclic phosphodiesterase 8